MSKNILMAMGLVTMLSVSAFAQSQGKFDLGIKAGGGGYTAIGLDNRGFGNVGVEGCAFCAGRFGMFGEYSRWFTSENPQLSKITSADLFAFGARIQGRQRVRPFFDIGLAVGSDSYPTSSLFTGKITGEHSHSTAGIVFGGGVTIPIKKNFYVRPQVRVYPMYEHAAVAAQVGFGWRF